MQAIFPYLPPYSYFIINCSSAFPSASPHSKKHLSPYLGLWTIKENEWIVSAMNTSNKNSSNELVSADLKPMCSLKYWKALCAASLKKRSSLSKIPKPLQALLESSFREIFLDEACLCLVASHSSESAFEVTFHWTLSIRTVWIFHGHHLRLDKSSKISYSTKAC